MSYPLDQICPPTDFTTRVTGLTDLEAELTAKKELEAELVYKGKGFVLKDSGQRSQFATGSVRDVQEGKGRFDLVPIEGIWRLAKWYEKGAKKYKDRNWEKGQPLSVMINSAIRHLLKYLAGWRDEDHLAAAAWNIFGIITIESRISTGRLPKELADLPEPLTEDQMIDP